MVRDKLGLSEKAQISIEFILIIVVMLAVLASVTFPTVNSMTDMTKDTARAVSLAGAQRMIINTAEEVSLGSCGSFKTIGVYIPPEVLSEPNLLWNETHVWGNFTTSDPTAGPKRLRALSYPLYVKIEGGVCPGGCLPAQNNTFSIKITKTCNSVNPRETPVCGILDPVSGEWNGVGVGVC